MPAPAPKTEPTVPELLAAAVGAMPGGVPREGQQRMARAVAEAIETGEHLLVQAGTGTGKSLGYLVPALHSGKRVVVATATLALQAQLIETDLPRLAANLTSILDRTPTFALLKGRHHYACKAKLADNAEDSLFETEGQQWLGEISRYGKQVTSVRTWAADSDTGDRADLDPGVDDLIWRQVSMPSRECIGATRCAFGEECFAEEARVRAREADVIVTNHTLLALDMLGGRTILPPHELLVIDEAHELAGHVTNAARAELNPETIRRSSRTLKSLVGAEIRDRFDAAEEALSGALPTVPPGRLVTLPTALAEALTLIDSAARAAAEAIGSIGGDDDQAVEKNQQKQALRELNETTQRLLSESEHDVAWIQEDDRGRQSLVVAPLSVAGLLATHAFTDRTVVATSATLTLGGRFDQLARSFGLTSGSDRVDSNSEPRRERSAETPAEDKPATPPWRGIDVGSPFDYARQGILYVAARLPRPGLSGLPDAAQHELIELIIAAGGRTLGLFSSRKAASQAAEIARNKTDMPILLQGEDTLGALVRRFRDDPRTCLFGVMSLWQGVDAPGTTCQLVVVDRLPFPRPDDPLIAARAKLVEDNGGSGFAAVSVPHAAVRLAQGAGRLIRSASDRGVVAVLDSRLHNSGYGAFVRRSLPPFWYTSNGETAKDALRRLDATATHAEKAR